MSFSAEKRRRGQWGRVEPRNFEQKITKGTKACRSLSVLLALAFIDPFCGACRVLVFEVFVIRITGRLERRGSDHLRTCHNQVLIEEISDRAHSRLTNSSDVVRGWACPLGRVLQ